MRRRGLMVGAMLARRRAGTGHGETGCKEQARRIEGRAAIVTSRSKTRRIAIRKGDLRRGGERGFVRPKVGQSVWARGGTQAAGTSLRVKFSASPLRRGSGRRKTERSKVARSDNEPARV